MNRKTTLDITIFISCLIGMILSYVYLDNYTEKEISLLIEDLQDFSMEIKRILMQPYP